MPTPVIFDRFKQDVAHKVHNLSSDSLKVALTNTLPDVSTAAVLTDITQIAAGAGYTAGGYAIATTSSGQTAGTYSLVLGAVNIAASGGTMETWRWAVLYNDTAASDPVIALWDRGSPISLASGSSTQIDAGTWLTND